MKRLTYQNKINFIKGLFWDYNLSPYVAIKLLNGEKNKVGHYTQETLFKKLLETYPWHTVIQIIPITQIKKLLNDNLIKKIRHKSLRDNFEYAKKRLQEPLHYSK